MTEHTAPSAPSKKWRTLKLQLLWLSLCLWVVQIVRLRWSDVFPPPSGAPSPSELFVAQVERAVFAVVDVVVPVLLLLATLGLIVVFVFEKGRAKILGRAAMFIVIGVVVGLGGFALERWQGRLAEDVQARLEIRWPDLMALPEPKRAQIVKAALACDLLHKSAPTPGAIEVCVREGALELGQESPDF